MGLGDATLLKFFITEFYLSLRAAQPDIAIRRGYYAL
jgi:hypothetical protein